MFDLLNIFFLFPSNGIFRDSRGRVFEAESIALVKPSTVVDIFVVEGLLGFSEIFIGILVWLKELMRMFMDLKL
jgi:hypothetical protein